MVKQLIKEGYSVKDCCEALELSRSRYYSIVKPRETEAPKQIKKALQLLLKIRDIKAERLGAHVEYNDPYFSQFSSALIYKYDKKSVDLTPETLSSFDCVVVVTARNLLKNYKEYFDKVVKA